MKRMVLDIDLQENKIFEKEFEELVRAKVRELTRIEHAKVIEDEVAKEVIRLTESTALGYKNKLNDLIKIHTADSIKRVISNADIKSITEECINDRIEYIISQTTSMIEKKCKEILEKTINEAVQKKLSSILGSIDLE